jgi:hypothetical protein
LTNPDDNGSFSLHLYCDWNGPVYDILLPHSQSCDTFDYYFHGSIQRSRIGLNFVALDMFDRKKMVRNIAKEWVPTGKDFEKVKNIIWSDTLEIR